MADACPVPIAAFCCLAELANPFERMGKLVGAVGLEPSTFGLKSNAIPRQKF